MVTADSTVRTNYEDKIVIELRAHHAAADAGSITGHHKRAIESIEAIAKASRLLSEEVQELAATVADPSLSHGVFAIAIELLAELQNFADAVTAPKHRDDGS
jgi:hypothetical protein